MERPGENPFRPEDELWHEVDPIVDAYKHRPFPPTGSPGKSSAGGGADAADGRPTSATGRSPDRQQQQQQQQQQQSAGAKTSPGAIKSVAASGTGGSANGGGGGGGAQQQHVADVSRANIQPPKAGTVELVHVEDKRRKCGCCDLQ